MKVSWLALGMVVTLAAPALFVRAWLRERRRAEVYPARLASGLLHPARRLLQHPARTVDAFGIAPGNVVLEIGPGPGYFTMEAVRAAGESGRVVCVDIQPGMLRTLQTRLRDAAVTGAHPIAGDATRLPLRDAAIDNAYLVAVLGEIPDRPATIRELRRVMRAGGVLSFCETLTDPDYQFESRLRDLCTAFGFRPLARRGVPLGYIASFQAPAEGRDSY